MGTVMNGKKWAGACVNGKTVSGLAKNGIVFYRKPVSTYRRRIMVGDSLGGKVISSDFPTGYYSTFPSGTTSFTTLVESNGTPLIYENIKNSPEYIEITSDEMLLGNTPYQYDDGEETITGEMTIDDYDTFNVTNITDNSSYRHLFIEDKNIRPLKVGDKIVAGTKIYFNYPDNYYEQWPADGTYNDVIRVGGLGSFYHSRYSSGAMSISLDGFASFFHLSEYIYETDDNGNVSTNKSYVEFTQDEGEVTYVDTNYSHPAATKYILVDKTTLGA